MILYCTLTLIDMQVYQQNRGNKITDYPFQLTAGNADDAHIPGSEEILIERHSALIVVRDVEENYNSFIYIPGHKKLKVMYSLSQLSLL